MLSSTPPTYGRERPVPETGQDKDEQVITFSSPSSKDSEVSHDAVATQENNKNLTSGLPFSKARCIGLTVTLTGASFLNVSMNWMGYLSPSEPVSIPPLLDLNLHVAFHLYLLFISLFLFSEACGMVPD